MTGGPARLLTLWRRSATIGSKSRATYLWANRPVAQANGYRMTLLTAEFEEEADEWEAPRFRR